MAYGLTKSSNYVAANSESLTYAGDVGIAGNAVLTMEGWIRVTSNTNGAFMTHASTTGTDNYIWGRYNNSTGKLAVSSGYANPIEYTANLTVGTWYHIGITRTAVNAIELFIDGTSVATGTVGAQPLSTAIVSIGKAYNASEFFDGDISLVRYWNEIRTASQLSTNQCSVLGSTTNLKGEWTVDDTLTDNSGNGYTLTNNNTVTFTTALPGLCSVIAYTLTTSVGAFTLTGIANILNRGWKNTVTVGSFTLTGIDALFSRGKGFTAEVGQFTLTGIDVLFQSIKTMTATVGEFTLTGIDVLLNKGKTLMVDTGSFILTGIDAGICFARSIAVTVGEFTLTGVATTFTYGRNMVAEVGSFILTWIPFRIDKEIAQIWTNVSKSVTTFLNSSKSSTDWENLDKN